MKCKLFDCENRKDEGRFQGEFCIPCYLMLVTGDVRNGKTFIHKLAKENESLKMRLDDLTFSNKKLVEKVKEVESHAKKN